MHNVSGYHDLFRQKTRAAEPMLSKCWSTVCDAGPTITQHWLIVSRLLGRRVCEVCTMEYFLKYLYFATNSYSEAKILCLVIKHKEQLFAIKMQLILCCTLSFFTKSH